MLPQRSNVLFCRSLSITIAFGAVVMLLLFSACSGRHKDMGDAITERDSLPVMDTKGVMTLISDSGITRYRMNAKEWLVFGKAKEPYSYFPQGVYVEKFDSLFNVEASVKADTAYYWDKKGLYKLIGHVSILSQEGKKLDTSILYFDQKEDQIYTDEYFELEEGDKIITGIGFKSNQNMTKYKIFNSQGTFPVSDTARDTSRVNTATGDSVAVNIAKPDSIK